MRKSYYVTTIDKQNGFRMVLCESENNKPIFVRIDSDPKNVITFTYKDDALDYVYRYFGGSGIEIEVPEKYTFWR